MTKLPQRTASTLREPEGGNRSVSKRASHSIRMMGVALLTAATANVLITDKSTGWLNEEACSLGNPAEATRLTSKLINGFALPRVYKATNVAEHSRNMAEQHKVRLAVFDNPYAAIEAAPASQTALAPLNSITRAHFGFGTDTHNTDVSLIKQQAKSTVRRLENIPPALILDKISALHIADPLPDGYDENANGLARYDPLFGEGKTNIYVKTDSATLGHEIGHAFFNNFLNLCTDKSELYRPLAAANPRDFSYTGTDDSAPNWHGNVLRPRGSRLTGEDAADLVSALLTPLDALESNQCEAIRTSKVLSQKLGVVANAFNLAAPGTGDYAVSVLPFACTQVIRK